MGKAVATVPVWVVASGKGGVGVSALVASLASLLARRGAEVLAVEAGARGAGDLGVYLGRDPRLGGVAAAGIRVARTVSARVARDLARTGVPRADRVLMDRGSIAPGDLSRAFSGATRRVLVTTGEPAAVEATLRLLDALASVPDRQRGPIDLIVNQARRTDDAEIAGHLARAAAERFGLTMRLRGVVAWDDRLWIAQRKRLPAWDGGWGRTFDEDVADLADRIEADRDVSTAALPRADGAAPRAVGQRRDARHTGGGARDGAPGREGP